MKPRELPRSKSLDSAYGFSQEEINILNRNGITPAAAHRILNHSEQVLCSLRGNDSEKLPSVLRLTRHCYPKPGTIQAKSCNVGPGSSFVAFDPDYSKVEITKDGPLITPRKPGDFPENQPTKAAPVALQELLAGIQHGEYELVSAKDGGIMFKLSKKEAQKVPEAIRDDYYYINLNPYKGFPPLPLKDEEAIGLDTQNILKKPKWWRNDELGNYELISRYSFELNYKKSNSDFFKRFLVAGVNFNGQIVPVIGDYDQFVLGFSAEYAHRILEKIPEANQPIYAMASNEEGVNQLIDERRKIEIFLIEQQLGCKFDPEDPVHYAYKEEMDLRLLSGQFVKGNITPLESYYSDKLNKVIANDMPHIGNFFQHASEARNPYKPSKMGTVVFFADGKIYECKGPRAIADFLLNKALPKFHFDIHPLWDMKYFGPIVKRQMELGHRVLPEVAKAYHEWAQINVTEKDAMAHKRVSPRFFEGYNAKEPVANNKERAEREETVAKPRMFNRNRSI